MPASIPLTAAIHVSAKSMVEVAYYLSLSVVNLALYSDLEEMCVTIYQLYTSTLLVSPSLFPFPALVR